MTDETPPTEPPAPTPPPEDPHNPRVTHKLLACAEAAHEALRIFCQAHGKRTFRHWGKLDQKQKQLAIQGTARILAGSIGPGRYEPTEDVDMLATIVHREVAAALARAFMLQEKAKKPTIEIVTEMPKGLIVLEGGKDKDEGDR